MWAVFTEHTHTYSTHTCNDAQHLRTRGIIPTEQCRRCLWLCVNLWLNLLMCVSIQGTIWATLGSKWLVWHILHLKCIVPLLHVHLYSTYCVMIVVFFQVNSLTRLAEALDYLLELMNDKNREICKLCSKILDIVVVGLSPETQHHTPVHIYGYGVEKIHYLLYVHMY